MRNHDAPGAVTLPATIYDLLVRRFVMRGREQQFRGLTADLARIGPGEAVLDVGCGTGTMALAAKRRVGESGWVVGIDPSPQMLAGARRKAARAGLAVDFQLAGVDRLDLPDDAFDVAMGTFMIHHLPDKVTRSGLAELRRVLKPGGRLLLIDFKRAEQDKADLAKFGEGSIGVQELGPLLRTTGFTDIRLGDMPFRIRSVARSHNDYGYVLAARN
jgi:ubiquinone/menaquinone biosynthesis C-methylase UbiE